MAVPYIEDKTRVGVEVRNVKNGERVDLRGPNSEVIWLTFSPDGAWLVLETSAVIRIYNSKSWAFYDFPLQKDDLRFVGHRIEADTEHAHAEGRESGPAEYDYVIKLAAKGPVLSSRVESPIGSLNVIPPPDPPDILTKETEGWDTGNPYKYEISFLTRLVDSDWVANYKCRSQFPKTSNCDVQFVPTNVKKLMSIYDSLLWKPTSDELRNWLH
jgi:hypothetical protein